MTSLVVMVAGMSSRFGGNPKQMAIVGPNNETLIEYSVNQAIKNAFDRIIFITNSKTEKLFVDIFQDRYKDIPVIYIQQSYDEQRIRPWGTGDAVASLFPIAKKTKSSKYIIINGDDIYGEDTFYNGFNLLCESSSNIIAGLLVSDTLPEEGNVNRGIITIDGDNVVHLEERLNISKKKNPELLDKLSNVNFLGLQLEALEHLYILNDKFKTENKDDEKIESLLTDHLNNLVYRNLINLKYFYIRNKILGITNPGDELKLKDILSN